MPTRSNDIPPQLQRLEEIAASLQGQPTALALLGLGSVGLELERLDAYSDLDFFVIVAQGHKQAFIKDLGWLSTAHPLAFAFRNSSDGYKALFEDGIFCEFAVFELPELANIPYAPGRIVWKRPEVGGWISQPQLPAPSAPVADQDWLVGEILTNLYVGLGRYRRGEKLSAAQFVQVYAIDRLIELVEMIIPGQPGVKDPFTPERRFETRYPQMETIFPRLIQGYERTPQSAQAILSFLKQHIPINPAMEQAILGLCAECI